MLLDLDVSEMPHTRLLIGISTGKSLTSCQNISIVPGHCLKFLKLWRHVWFLFYFFSKARNTFLERYKWDVSRGKLGPHLSLCFIVSMFWCFFFQASQKSFCQHGHVFSHGAQASLPVNIKLKARAAVLTNLFSRDPTHVWMLGSCDLISLGK